MFLHDDDNDDDNNDDDLAITIARRHFFETDELKIYQWVCIQCVLY